MNQSDSPLGTRGSHPSPAGSGGAALPSDLEDRVYEIYLDTQIDGREAAFAALVSEHVEQAPALSALRDKLLSGSALFQALAVEATSDPSRIGLYRIVRR